MASGQREIPGNTGLKYETNEREFVFALILLVFFRNLNKNTTQTKSLVSSCSYRVGHIAGDLRRLFVSHRNVSEEHQLWRAHGRPYELPAPGHVCQHPMERPCHPTAPLQEHCRGAFPLKCGWVCNLILRKLALGKRHECALERVLYVGLLCNDTVC